MAERARDQRRKSLCILPQDSGPEAVKEVYLQKSNGYTESGTEPSQDGENPVPETTVLTRQLDSQQALEEDRAEVVRYQYLTMRWTQGHLAVDHVVLADLRFALNAPQHLVETPESPRWGTWVRWVLDRDH